MMGHNFFLERHLEKGGQLWCWYPSGLVSLSNRSVPTWKYARRRMPFSRPSNLHCYLPQNLQTAFHLREEMLVVEGITLSHHIWHYHLGFLNCDVCVCSFSILRVGLNGQGVCTDNTWRGQSIQGRSLRLCCRNTQPTPFSSGSRRPHWPFTMTSPCCCLHLWERKAWEINTMAVR